MHKTLAVPAHLAEKTKLNAREKKEMAKYGHQPLTAEEVAEAQLRDIEHAEVQQELAKTAYKLERAAAYPALTEFADAVYWQQRGDDSKMAAWLAKCEEVKNSIPKPAP